MSRDLMNTLEVQRLVRDAYRNVPPTTASVAHKLYTDEELAGVPDCALYPLFSEEVITLMRDLIPPERHREVAVAVVVTARLA